MNDTAHTQNVLSLHGALTLENVTNTWQASRSILNDGIDTIDLSEVSNVDSAGLALLLEWQARANARDRRLRITGAPDDLLRLASLCEATELLGLDGRPPSGET
ncbi:MAG: STAS domain-containing protein [Xanthomonadales bacterium]|nr:STAS domain-containing protein [Xanthomonadales bacterium]